MIKGSSKNKNVGRKTIPKKKCWGKCGKEKSISLFYTSDNPNHTLGRLNICKECIKPNDVNDTDEIIGILKGLDRPFLPEQWSKAKKDAQVRYGNLEGAFGLYLTKLKNPNTKLSNLKSKDSKKNDFPLENSSEEIDNEEEKIFSKKWMGKYTLSDIELLDDYITGLENDFKIVTTNHKDYAKKIAKASLHMDKSLQEMLEGVAGADKKYKDAKEVFDTLSKSAQFSESQRGQNDVSLGCFGVTFDQVEQKKWIPKHIPMEDDAIDKILNQFASIRESV